jgi:transcriptional regulator with XRE-family HTH domain
LSFVEQAAEVGAGNLAEAGEFSVGRPLRELRLARRLTLQAVAERASISESFLSQIERGKAAPSLQVLFRIASVFGLTPGDLLADQLGGSPVLIRKHSRQVIATEDYSKQRLIPHMVKSVEVLGGTLEPRMSVGAQYTHGDSDELLVVVRGSIRAEVGEQAFEMSEGDSLYYRSSTPHTLVNIGDSVADVIWIIAPPA